MTTTRAAVADWLDRYVQAWRTYDPAAIGELFSEDATYAYHPWDEQPVSGRDAIVANWLEDQDAPGSWEAAYEPLAVDGDVAIATGRTRYTNPDGSVRDEYYNSFVLRFDGEGRCVAFTEWFMKPSGTSPA
jgi:ketosteroid isomerase-like protein